MGGEAQCGPRVLSPRPWFLVKAAVGTVDAQAQPRPFLTRVSLAEHWRVWASWPRGPNRRSLPSPRQTQGVRSVCMSPS